MAIWHLGVFLWKVSKSAFFCIIPNKTNKIFPNLCKLSDVEGVSKIFCTTKITIFLVLYVVKVSDSMQA